MILWLNPFSGVSGDMLLGALLAVGAPVERVRAAIAATGLQGWSLRAEQVDKSGIAAIRAVVEVHDTATERHAAELLERAAAAPGPVAAVATRAIRALAEAEGALHGTAPEDVHLHEVGGLDTIVDTVGVAAAVHELGVQEVRSGPVALGAGTVRCAHGLLPAPAPATWALLQDAEVVGSPVAGETTTPTGAALLTALGTGYGPPPAMRVRATGYGAGTRDFPQQPNVLPLTLGEPLGAQQRTVLLETNLDDVTAELLGHLVETALGSGALDAWTTPCTGKKSRPGHVLHLLCPVDREEALSALVFRETGTLGLRRTPAERTTAPRSEETVEVRGHPIRVKHGPWRSKPEHDDVARAAAALGEPLRAVAARALAECRGTPHQPS